MRHSPLAAPLALAMLATAGPFTLTTAGPALAQPSEATAIGSLSPGEPQKAVASPSARTQALLRTFAEAPDTVVRHLPASRHELTLAGEHAVRRIPVYFTVPEAGRVGKFRITAQTAVSALPAASRLEVRLNGTTIGTLRPSADGPSSLTVDLDPGQVVPGFNEVTLVASHQHRVDCSLEGTYELWTRVEPGETGFVVTAADDGAPSVADLPAVLGTSAAPTTLKVMVPRELDGDAATRIGRFVNTTVLNGWIANPEIVLAGAADPRPGVSLSVMPALPAEADGTVLTRFADSEHLYLRTDGAGRALGLVLAGPPAALERELDRLEEMAGRRTAPGSDAGRAALVAAFGRELDEAGPITLAQLGLEDVSFIGRRFQVDVPMLLPGDYYEADYGNVHLYLDGAYAANLLDSSRLTVKVNGVETASLKLSGRGERVLEDRELRIPLRMFHAGMNTVTLEADLRTAADLSCAPEHAAVMTPRFRLDSTTRIVIPRMARVGVVPNLAATISHGLPYTLDAAPTDVFVVGDRRDGLGAGLALIGEIAANSQRVERFRFAFRPPSEDESGLLVGPWDVMPGWARVLVGNRVSDDAPPQIEDETPIAAAEPAQRQAEPVVLANRGDTVSDIAPLRQHLQPGATDADSAPVWESAVDFLGEARAWLPEVSAESLAGVREEVERIGELLVDPEGETARERVFVAGDLVFAQKAYAEETGLARLSAAVLDREPPRTWTVVAVDTADSLTAAMDGHAPAGVAFSPSGQHYVYSDARERTIEAGEAARLYATRAPAPGNLRLVLAAWLSANTQVYLTMLLSLLVAFAGLTFLAVRRRRVGRAS